MPSLSAKFFGSFDVELASNPLPPLRTRKGEQLLALLMLRQGIAAQRDWLAETLWPDSVIFSSMANLRRSLTDLRHALGDQAGRVCSPNFKTLSFDLTDASVDVLEFDNSLRSGDISSLARAVELYRGPFLVEMTDDWIAQERTLREFAFLSALEKLASHFMSQQNYEEAIMYLRRILAHDPMQESAQRNLMEALAWRGDYAAVTQVYRDLRLLLRQELNAEPSVETRLLYERLREEARQPHHSLTAQESSRITTRLVQVAARENSSISQMPFEKQTMTELSPIPDGPMRIVLFYKASVSPDGYILQLLTQHLKELGHQVYADRSQTGSIRWASETERQIINAEAFIVLLSSTSCQSELLDYEVQISQQAVAPLHTRLFIPVQIGSLGPVGSSIAKLLNRFPPIHWNGVEDDEKLVKEVVQALSEPGRRAGALAQDVLEPAGGAVPLDSKFYLERPTDALFTRALLRNDSIVLIKGSHQTGKTSLLGRGLHAARVAGNRVVQTHCQRLTASDLQSAEAFYLTLAQHLASQLSLDFQPSRDWNAQISGNDNFENFLRQRVFSAVSEHLVWSLDDLDKLFACTFADEVFALFRSWHNGRLLDPDGPWNRLTLAITYATEVHLFIRDLNQSPFNVGTRLALDDFQIENILELNLRYSRPLRNREAARRFHRLLGGHPHLIRRGLEEMSKSQTTIEALEHIADHDTGPFSDHLRHLFFLLSRNEGLVEATRGILRGDGTPSLQDFYHLRSAGLVVGEAPDEAQMRCQLYQKYLKPRLL